MFPSPLWQRLSWGLFLLLVVAAFLVTTGIPLEVSYILGIALVGIVVWQFPYQSFFVWMATAPLLGFLVSFPTGSVQFGERAFGGSIDVSLGELVAGALLAVWAVRLLLMRHVRRQGWKPWLPLAGAYALVVAAHILSVFSTISPDPILGLKYSLRPVLFVYLTCVLLPVNFLHTRRRLMSVLLLFGTLGVIFSVDGLRSLFVSGALEGFHRARPLPLLGVSPLGGNHNALAELLLFTAPALLAWFELNRSKRAEGWVALAVGGMFVVTLLTFARSAWIVLAAECALLGTTIWKPWIKQHLRLVLVLFCAFLPFLIFMVGLSFGTEVKGSTEARATITSIAWHLFKSSPWLGTGAGSFVERVSHVYAYTVEFGTPVDSHGLIQKLLSETGLIGLMAFAVLFIVALRHIRLTWQLLKKQGEESRAYMYLVAATLGAFVYQLFDTTYWTSRLWLPVGILLVAGRIFLHTQGERDPDFLSPSHGE